MKTPMPYAQTGTTGRLARRLMAARLRAAQEVTQKILDEQERVETTNPSSDLTSGPLHEMLQKRGTLDLPRALVIILDLSLAAARQIGHGEGVGQVRSRNVWIDGNGRAELLNPLSMTQINPVKVDSDPRTSSRNLLASLGRLLDRMIGDEDHVLSFDERISSLRRRLDGQRHGRDAFRSVLQLVEELRSLLSESGSLGDEALALRDRLRGDVHESYFYRGLEMIHGGHFLKGLSLWEELSHLPASVGQAYGKQMTGELRKVLRQLMEELVHRTPSAPELWQGMAALEGLHALARALEIEDVADLTQQIFILSCRRIPSRSEQYRICREIMRRHPDALAIGYRCLELARDMKQHGRAQTLCLILARRFHEAKRSEQAFDLAHQARQNARLRRRSDVLLRAVGAAHAKLELELIEFEERAQIAVKQGRRYDVLAAARNLCSNHPRSVDCWVHLADIQEDLAQRDESVATLLHGAAVAIGGAELDQARALYGRVLGEDPTCEEAHESLHVLLTIQQRLPEAPIDAPYRRLSTLLAQGLDDAAAHEFDELLRVQGFRPEELCLVLDLASQNDCHRVSALFDVTLGAFALAHDKYELARQYFVNALDRSPRPTEILERIEATPDHDVVLPLRGLMALKRLCAMETPGEVQSQSFRKRFRREVMRQTSSGPGLHRPQIG